MRGFAVMGILLMNIVGFAMPEMAYFSPAVYGGTDTPDIIVWALSFIFVDGKMRGLFTLLFGASMMLVVERAEANGQNAAKVHFSRMFWLALFGLAHFFFLWFGDILFLYAVVGCVAYFMVGLPSETLFRRALLLYVIGIVAFGAMMGSLLYLQYQAGQPGASAFVIAQYEDAIADFLVDDAAVAAEVSLYQSGFSTIVMDKITNSLFQPLSGVVFSFMETLPLMMIGMALYKDGFFTGGWERAQYKSWGIRFTLIGILLLVPMAIFQIRSDFEILRVLNVNFSWTAPSLLLMTIGYACLLILLIQKYANASWMHRVAAAGRVAFSNYLGTSIAMTFIFYGWGLGYFGQVDRAALYLLVLGAWINMLLWSRPWLMRYRYGPLEWLWRSLARLEVQKMRID